jgi:hypothetical protein
VADRRGQLPDAVSIHLRPPEANERAFPGHWEGDLLKGAANRSAVGVLVEQLASGDAGQAQGCHGSLGLEGFTAKLRSIAEPMRKTLTYDRGKEMARHPELTEATGIRVYFCDPRSPWQRGSCENINGLLRQYLPKGTDLSVYSRRARCDRRPAQQPPARHPRLLPSDRRLPGHAGKAHPSQPPSVIPLLHLVLDTADASYNHLIANAYGVRQPTHSHSLLEAQT